MRLWTLHPQYLDPAGLVALWREALLAQKVLAGATRGYRHHPQLERFRAHTQPVAAIATYLWHVVDEAERRGYRFDDAKILHARTRIRLNATSGQLCFEWEHLMAKLRKRAPALAAQHGAATQPLAHPMFHIVNGPVATWERGNA
jgi:hypothetical protein